MIRVAITDDHSIVRRGLRQIVADSAHLEVVIEAESYDAAKADFDRDPFMLAGLFDSVTIKRWHLGINNTKK